VSQCTIDDELLPVPQATSWTLMLPLAAFWHATNIASYYCNAAATSWCQDATGCAEEEEKLEKS